MYQKMGIENEIKIETLAYVMSIPVLHRCLEMSFVGNERGRKNLHKTKRRHEAFSLNFSFDESINKFENKPICHFFLMFFIF